MFLLLLTAILGVSALQVLYLRLGVGELVALAFGLGSGLTTLAVFGVLALGARFSTLTVLATLVVLCLCGGALAVWRTRRHGEPVRQRVVKPARPSMLTISLAAPSGVMVVYAMLMALYWPPWAWDVLAIWAVKAKAIFESSSLSGHLVGAYAFYPLHLPLQLAIVRLGLSERLTQGVIPFYFAGLLLVVVGGMARLGKTRSGPFFASLLAATPALLTYASLGYADVPFTFYYISSALCLLAFMSTRQIAFALLSGLLVGIAAWTRPEGLLYFLINLVVLLAYVLRTRSGLTATLTYVAAFCVFWGPWTLYTRLHGYGSYLVGPAVATLRDLAHLQVSLDRLAVVLRFFLAQWTAFDVWGSVWVLFWLSLLRWRAVRQHGYLVAITLLNIVALLFTYYATPEAPPLTWWLETGFSRMALHFVPLLWVYIGLAWETELVEAGRWYWGRVRLVFARSQRPATAQRAGR